MKKQNWIGGLAAVSSDQDTILLFLNFVFSFDQLLCGGKKEIKLSFFLFFLGVIRLDNHKKLS